MTDSPLPDARLIAHAMTEVDRLREDMIKRVNADQHLAVSVVVCYAALLALAVWVWMTRG